jgi:hypothetical protein
MVDDLVDKNVNELEADSTTTDDSSEDEELPDTVMKRAVI